VSGFSAQWLALREPYDLAARSAAVRDAVAEAFADRASIAAVDLACGTGSTLRAVGPHLPSRQSWRLVDNDLSLLARASALGRPPLVSVVAKPVDLARDLIELSGMRPDVDVDIEFIGLKSGEKLTEELLLEAEAYDRTPHPKIVIGRIGRVQQPAARTGVGT